MATTTVMVQRFDPQSDRQPYWATYEVDVGSTQTVLDALLLIAETIDPTLAFRRMCRSGICGACAGTVNGRPGLPCQALASETSVPAGRSTGTQIAVGPLPHFRILKDLVVDMQPFFNALGRANAWLVPSPSYRGVMPKQLVRKLWSAATCVLCGICAASSAGPDSLHPAAVTRILRLAHDPRDALGPLRFDLLKPAVQVDAEFSRNLVK